MKYYITEFFPALLYEWTQYRMKATEEDVQSSFKYYSDG